MTNNTTARETAHTATISEIVASLGAIGRYDARDLEAWMRIEHGTLDGLSAAEFRAEVRTAMQCVDAASPDDTASLRASYGL